MMSTQVEEILVFGGLRVDLSQRLVCYEAKQAKLGIRELNLLVALVREHNRVVTYQRLNRQIWGDHEAALSRRLRLAILRLRRKLLAERIEEIEIANIVGMGYRARMPQPQ